MTVARPVTAARQAGAWLDVCFAVALVLLTFLVAAYFAPRGFRAGFTDMAHDGYQLREVLDLDQGGTIFKDTFDQYGPLAAYLNLGGFRLFGRTMLAVKYAHAAWYAATAVILYLLARSLLSPWLSVWSVLLWLALAPFYQHGVMVSPHTYILFFQNLGALALIRYAGSARTRYLVVAGLSAGLCWALKTSMGVVFAAGLAAYLVARRLRAIDGTRQTVVALAVVGGGALTIVAATLTWLWAHGALNDWYIQTVAFPRAFYFENQGAALPSRPEMFASFAINFLLLNFSFTGVEVATYWHVLRATVVAGAGILWWRRSLPEALLVSACLTPLLWIGNYPSANFMHQWWTAAVAFPAFVFCAVTAAGWMSARWIWTRALAGATAVAVSLLIFLPGMQERLAAAQETSTLLTARLDEPPVLRGVYTDVATAEAFSAIYHAVRNFREHHPGVRIVSNDRCDGMNGCVAESLLWLSFLDGNTHDHPVYWPLPVLTTTLYPEYEEDFRRALKTEKPLVVDSWQGPVRADNGLEGYELLVGVRTRTGYWYVFAPKHDEAEAHGEVKVRLDQVAGMPARRANHGGGRRPLFDRAWEPATGSVRDLPLYTWPGHVDVPPLREPEQLEGFSLQASSPITKLEDGRLSVNGPLEPGISNQVLFKEQPVHPGDYFVAVGHVVTGGCQAGLLSGEDYLGYTSLDKPGPFALLFMPPKPGRYIVKLDCFGERWWQVLQRDGVSALPRIVRGMAIEVGFTLERTGWVRRDSAAPVMLTYQPSADIVPVDVELVGAGSAEAPVAAPAPAAGYPVFDAVTQGHHPAEIYASPADIVLPTPLPETQSIDVATASITAAIVSGRGPVWLVDGVAEARDSVLLEFPAASRRAGVAFVATGLVREGGLTLRLQQNGAAEGQVEITRPGWFAAALRVPEDGDYELIVANNVRAPIVAPPTFWQSLLRGVGVMRTPELPAPRNRFHIQDAGWTVAPINPLEHSTIRLVTDREQGRRRRATLYAWPPELSVSLELPAPRPVDLTTLNYKAPIVAADGGRWSIDGRGETRTSYLLEFKPAAVRKGSRFLATGVLEEGGFTSGLLRNNAWFGSRNVTEPGWFVIALQVPEDGEYALVFANNLPEPTAGRWQRWLRSVGLGALVPQPAVPVNRFRIQESGWIE